MDCLGERENFLAGNAMNVKECGKDCLRDLRRLPFRVFDRTCLAVEMVSKFRNGLAFGDSVPIKTWI